MKNITWLLRVDSFDGLSVPYQTRAKAVFAATSEANEVHGGVLHVRRDESMPAILTWVTCVDGTRYIIGKHNEAQYRAELRNEQDFFDGSDDR